jgi:hypothetical protein
MLATKLIKIDSDNRTNGTNESFIYTLRSDIKISQAELVYASIPNTYYNIIASVALAVNDGLGGIITITPGQYTISELCALVQSTLIASSGDATYTCIFDAITMRVTIANTTPVVFQLNFSGEAELANRLGFANTDIVGLSTYTGDVTPELTVQEYYINIAEIGIIGDGANPSDRFTFVVPRTGLRGDYSIYTQETNFNQTDFAGPLTLFSYTVELRKRDGTLYDLNGANWTMIISTGHA